MENPYIWFVGKFDASLEIYQVVVWGACGTLIPKGG